MIEKNTTHKVCFVTYGKFKAGPEGVAIVKKYFENVTVVVYNPDETENHDPVVEKARRDGVRRYLDTLDYDYLISFWAFLFFREQDFKKAKLGAINFHPCPPEHRGLACYVYPLLFPEKRNFHGVTMHEIDEKMDNGKIYRTVRFPIGNMTGSQLFLHTYSLGKEMLESVCQKLASGCPTSELLDPACSNEKWSEHYFTGKYEKELIKDLPLGHPIREMNLFDGSVIYQDFAAPEVINEDYPW
jgi:methionyl-tRNA formyltransferase